MHRNATSCEWIIDQIQLVFSVLILIVNKYMIFSG